MCDPRNESKHLFDHPHFSKRILKVLPSYFEDHSKILHLLCGEGDATKKLVKAHPNVLFVGIDEKEVSLKAAEEGRGWSPNLFFRLEEAAYIDPSEEFDTVVAVFNEEMLAKAADHLKQTFRLLQQNGNLYLLVYQDTKSSIYQEIKKFTQSHQWQGFFRSWEEITKTQSSEWIELLLRLGYEKVVYHEHSSPFVLSDLAESKSVVTHIVDYYCGEQLPNIHKPQFHDSLKQALLDANILHESWIIYRATP